MTFNLLSKENVLPLMKEYGLLTIEDIFRRQVAVFMLKYYNHSLPPAFDYIFQSKTSSIITRRNSRFLSSAVIPLVNNQSGILNQKYGILFPFPLKNPGILALSNET